MFIYYLLKKYFLHFLIKVGLRLKNINLIFFYRKRIKKLVKTNRLKKLSQVQKKQIKRYYKERGYKNVKMYWHQYYTANNHFFSEKYIPEDVFHTIISNAVNEMKQWPALLDKNLLETIFKDFKQPVSVVKNINGFFYVNNREVSKIKAIDECFKYYDKLVIKPSIESGRGRNVIGFSTENKIAIHNNLLLEDLFDSYKKDFIIQKVVHQHPNLKLLNESSLNTLRIMTYLSENQVHILSSLIRVGSMGSFTDNHSVGRVVCGIKSDGSLKDFGYLVSGKRKSATDSKIKLKGVVIPSYDKAIEMVKEMHYNVPYFRIISWDIGIDDENDPVLIEYNTYRQGIQSHQIANGPLFGKFTDELLEIGRKYMFKMKI